MSKVCLVGGGNGAHALAYHLSSTGNDVSMYPGSKFVESISAIFETGKIVTTGVMPGEAPVTALREPDAIRDMDFVFIVAPSFAQEPLFAEIVEYLNDSQMVISMPGNMASLCYRRMLNDKGIDKHPVFAESYSILHAVRVTKPGEAAILGLKNSMSFSILGSANKEEGIKRLKEIIPIDIKLAKNVLTTTLGNFNAIVHPIPTLLNAGRVDAGTDDWFHYRDGISDSVAKVLEFLEDERMAISDAYHADCTPFLKAVSETYGNYDSIRDFAKNSPVHNAAHVIANNFGHRYVSEDGPYILAVWLTFAKMAKVSVPILESSIVLLSAITGLDYFEVGRNLVKMGLEGETFNDIYGEKLEKLGLAGKSIEEVLELIK